MMFNGVYLASATDIKFITVVWVGVAVGAGLTKVTVSPVCKFSVSVSITYCIFWSEFPLSTICIGVVPAPQEPS